MTCELNNCACNTPQPPVKACCDACGKSGKCCGGGGVPEPTMPYDCEGGLLDGPRWLAGTGLGAGDAPAIDTTLQALQNDATACAGAQSNTNVTAFQQTWNATFPGMQIPVSGTLDTTTVGAINSYLAQIGASWTWTCVNGQFAQGPAPAPAPLASSSTPWGTIALAAGGAAALAALWMLKKPAGVAAPRYATRRRRAA